MTIHITKSQAKRFLLRKQLLYPPYSLSGKRAVETVFQTLRVIQYDPLNPCGRNTDLVLQSRIEGYHPDDYLVWLYKEKKGIECHDKELCILPLEDFSLSRIRQGQIQSKKETTDFLKKHKNHIEHLLKKIEKEGPVSSSDIGATHSVISNWGAEATFGRVALETLWKMGRLVVVKRENGRKWYDIPGRVHPSLRIDDETYSLTKEHIVRRMRAVGLLPLAGSGGGWQGLGPVRKIKNLIKDLVSTGELIEVDIEDCKRKYVIVKGDEKLLAESIQNSRDKKVSFIAPLDNLMWDREMIHELFNFHYRWEVYTPIQKRKYGYYVLPILYGDEFIGRIEPVLTKDKKLIIKGFWQEDKKEWNESVRHAFDEGLDNFRKYLGALVINKPAL